ncbi:GAF and ANTAR domain-containing protein [Kribbella sp. NPDC000426]|uniref:GAF and ANTAR domain-containing protein n=1 Tax=Kribbella sp. NPDC000426 TaxID=3154255 RepID=UPI003322E9F6
MEQEILDLAQDLAEIGRLVDDDDVTTVLDRFVRRVVLSVPECEEASITVLTHERPEIIARHHKTAADVAEPSRAALAEQLCAPGGPLQETLLYGEPRRIGDLAADHRWPDFDAAAINAGYRSCLFLPLPAAASGAAAFTLFSVKPDAFGATSYDVVLLFAMHAGVAFDNITLYDDSTQLIEHLQSALQTRTVIGQAQGILMHRYDISSDVAFDVLKRGSQDQNVKLRNLSLELVDAQHTGNLTQALQQYGLGQ